MMADFTYLLHILVVLLSALGVLLLGTFTKTRWILGVFSFLSLVISTAFIIGTNKFYESASTTIFNGTISVDPFTWWSSVLILFAAIFSVIFSFARQDKEGIDSYPEYYSLMLFSVAGALVLVSFNSYLTLFIGLELMSIPLYCLVSSSVWSGNGSESGIKYFVLGAFSSAIFLYGVALIFGVTGSMLLSDTVYFLTNNESNDVLILGLFMVISTLLFKMGVAPFHVWVPDVYQGAPLSVTNFMASVVKVAAITAFLRVIVELSTANITHVYKFLWIASLLSMVIGNLIALKQKNIIRMLSFSSVAHVGYIMIGICAISLDYGYISNTPTGDSNYDIFLDSAIMSVIFYSAVYIITTIGIFASISYFFPNESKLTLRDVNQPIEEQVKSKNIWSKEINISCDNFRGIGKTKPLYSACLSLFLLTLAGLPPGFGGLLAKVFIFTHSVQKGVTGLVTVGLICSVISLFYYGKIIFLMYSKPEDSISPMSGESGSLIAEGITKSNSLSFLIITCALITLALGLVVPAYM